MGPDPFNTSFPDFFAHYYAKYIAPEVARESNYQVTPEQLEKERQLRIAKAVNEANDNYRASLLLAQLNAQAAAARGETQFVSPLLPDLPTNTPEQREYAAAKRKELQEQYERLKSYFSSESDNALAFELNKYGFVGDLKKFAAVETGSVYGYAIVEEYIARLQTGRLRITDGQIVVGESINLAALGAAGAAILAPILATPTAEPGGNPNYPTTPGGPSPFPDPITGTVVVPGPNTGAGGNAVAVGQGGNNTPLPPGRLRPPRDGQGNIIGGPFGSGLPDGFFQANPPDP